MLVSVIIPTYNRASMLPDAIDSVLRQTYPHREIIVVDDGSTDETPSVLARYGDAIRVIRQKNQGAGVARNRALEAARGDLIAFLDSDDEWLDFKLALQVEIMRVRPDVGFLHTEFLVRREEDHAYLHGGLRMWHHNQADWGKLYESSYLSTTLGLTTPVPEFRLYTGHMYRMLLHHYHILPTTSVVRRELITDGIRFAEGPIVFEDWEFFSRLARNNVAAFADIETAINRGHLTPGRLTLCTLLTKYQARVAMMERVWEADLEFMEDYGREVRRLKGELLSMIARDALLDNQPALARDALKHRAAMKLPSTAQTMMYSMLAHSPGGARAMRFTREAVHVSRGLIAALTTLASWSGDA